eukprot:TRINITY_DN11683_c0_g1_i1.p1 TRINITY_DN11683_c0_g1~~TRINITY_DN11683_c0_g1_i1.p1  ORF type:complete len:406 (-),score=72.62 TRINITY_DN11683_c0_g1_i1:88-1305(-)
MSAVSATRQSSSWSAIYLAGPQGEWSAGRLWYDPRPEAAVDVGIVLEAIESSDTLRFKFGVRDADRRTVRAWHVVDGARRYYRLADPVPSTSEESPLLICCAAAPVRTPAAAAATRAAHPEPAWFSDLPGFSTPQRTAPLALPASSSKKRSEPDSPDPRGGDDSRSEIDPINGDLEVPSWRSGVKRLSYCEQSQPCKPCRDFISGTGAERRHACKARPTAPHRRTVRSPHLPADELMIEVASSVWDEGPIAADGTSGRAAGHESPPVPRSADPGVDLGADAADVDSDSDGAMSDTNADADASLPVEPAVLHGGAWIKLEHGNDAGADVVVDSDTDASDAGRAKSGDVDAEAADGVPLPNVDASPSGSRTRGENMLTGMHDNQVHSPGHGDVTMASDDCLPGSGNS